MKGDLLINGLDAWDTYGVNMSDNFIDVLCSTASMKDYVTSNSRLEDGIRVITENAKIDSRDLTLVFTLTGKDKEDYLQKKTDFEEVLYNASVTISIPPRSEEIYFLKYQKCMSFAESKTRRFCKIAVKFIEPDPTRRTASQ